MKREKRHSKAHFVACLCAFALLFFTHGSVAQGAKAARTHGLSAFGELHYPINFKHFSYVNPNAPKGGTLIRLGTSDRVTFDSLNGYILKGNPAHGVSWLQDAFTLIHDSLMARAFDEADAMYGLVAREAALLPNKNGVRFFLRNEARFNDGTPLRAADVVASFTLLKNKAHPIMKLQLRDVTSAIAIDPLTVEYRFKGLNTRDLPMVVAALPIFSKAYYAKHDFTKTTLEPPLGSGPYVIEKAEAGKRIIYKRAQNYWAAKLPVNVGRYNFDRIIIDYYRDRTAEFEALKAGQISFREEFTSKVWATQYQVPPVKQGRLLRMVVADGSLTGAQGYFINTRRKKFADPRVREALGLALDFEWLNRNQFHNLYKRTRSFFENSDLVAVGQPSKAELALLEPHRAALKKAGFNLDYIFGMPFTAPVSDGSGRDRKLLLRAGKMLDAAGWKMKNGQRVNARGETLEVEFLNFASDFERILSPFVRNLEFIGVKSRIRTVDIAQYEKRMKQFDFDITMRAYGMLPTPGIELRDMMGSHNISAEGSFNIAGITNPVVDALIEKISASKSREELRAATRALDRVIRAGHYWIPNWYRPFHPMAFWDEFAWPTQNPRYDPYVGVMDTWWFDKSKGNPRTRQPARTKMRKPPVLTPLPGAR